MDKKLGFGTIETWIRILHGQLKRQDMKRNEGNLTSPPNTVNMIEL